MKKYTAIVLMLLLCFTLLGCEKPEEPVDDTPVVDDTQAPETVTPNEVVTPSEVEPEVVTPNEPEVPIEPETPVEPDPPTEPEQPEENVIMLPEADENTKYITIDFPEDFPEEPYTEPNLVSPEDFDWGEYVPFVEFDEWMFRQHMYEYAFGIITGECHDLEDSKEIYEKLNNNYLIESDIINGKYCAENEALVTDTGRYGNRFTDFLFKSKIIYISEEADKFGRIRYVCDGDEEGKYIVDLNWTQIYEIYDNGVIKNSIEKPSAPHFNAGGYINNSSHDFLHPEIEMDIDHQKYNIEFIDEKTCLLKERRFGEDYFLLRLYSLQNEKIEYTIKLPHGLYSGFYAEQCIDGRYILFTVYKGVYDADVDFCTHYYYNTYLYDLEMDTFSFIEKYTLNPCISPDKKYLCYTSDTSEAYGFGTEDLMPRGFYIKNLENGETVFYEDKTTGLFGVMSWVNEEKLMELIEKSGEPPLA